MLSVSIPFHHSTTNIYDEAKDAISGVNVTEGRGASEFVFF